MPLRLSSCSKLAHRCPGSMAARSQTKACAAASVSKMSVSETMANLKENGRTALVPFICAGHCAKPQAIKFTGDPDLETTPKALVALDEAGCDVIELGVPYSDPLADGPTIQSAADRALRAGTTLQKVIDMLSGVSDRLRAPVVLFTYYNPIMARGLDKFCADIKAAGASGLLVPDIPLEETDAIREACNNQGLQLVLLTTPTTGVERMNLIAQKTQGFLYLVSVTGVTGARAEVSGRVQDLIAQIKAKTDKPINVGFGVSTPEQAKQIKDWGADGVIVGSALVKLVGSEGVDAMAALAKELRKALD